MQERCGVPPGDQILAVGGRVLNGSGVDGDTLLKDLGLLAHRWAVIRCSAASSSPSPAFASGLTLSSPSPVNIPEIVCCIVRIPRTFVC